MEEAGIEVVMRWGWWKGCGSGMNFQFINSRKPEGTNNLLKLHICECFAVHASVCSCVRVLVRPCARACVHSCVLEYARA